MTDPALEELEEIENSLDEDIEYVESGEFAQPRRRGKKMLVPSASLSTSILDMAKQAWDAGSNWGPMTSADTVLNKLQQDIKNVTKNFTKADLARGLSTHPKKDKFLSMIKSGYFTDFTQNSKIEIANELQADNLKIAKDSSANFTKMSAVTLALEIPALLTAWSESNDGHFAVQDLAIEIAAIKKAIQNLATHATPLTEYTEEYEPSEPSDAAKIIKMKTLIQTIGSRVVRREKKIVAMKEKIELKMKNVGSQSNRGLWHVGTNCLQVAFGTSQCYHVGPHVSTMTKYAQLGITVIFGGVVLGHLFNLFSCHTTRNQLRQQSLTIDTLKLEVEEIRETLNDARRIVDLITSRRRL